MNAAINILLMIVIYGIEMFAIVLSSFHHVQIAFLIGGMGCILASLLGLYDGLTSNESKEH